MMLIFAYFIDLVIFDRIVNISQFWPKVVAVVELANVTSELHDEMDRGSHFSTRAPWGGWGGKRDKQYH